MHRLRGEGLLARIEFTPIRLAIELSLVEYSQHVARDEVQAIRHLYQACLIQKQPQAWVRLSQLCRANGLLDESEFALRQAQQLSTCLFMDQQHACLLA